MAFTTINDPSAYFQTALYTGNGSTQSITNDGNSNLQPDFLWVKGRTGAGEDHKLTDSTRGVTYTIESNEDTTQYNDTNGSTAFNSDGFSLGDNGNYNDNGNTYAAWQWKCNGGTTASNSDGSITSTVQTNTTPGFSIVKWTGTTSNATVGHGLGVAPDCIFFKNYTDTSNWTTYHSILGNSGGMYLNLTDAFNTASSWYQDTSPTSSVFSVGTNSKTNGGTMVAYCFANIKGFSRCSIFKGTGDATDGAFIYCGFKPAYIMMKKSSDNSGANWGIFDIKREGYNSNNQDLRANTNSGEGTDADILDITSTGFKIRSTSGGFGGGDGSDYIYLAFAQQPLVASNTVCATTRVGTK